MAILDDREVAAAVLTQIYFDKSPYAERGLPDIKEAIELGQEPDIDRVTIKQIGKVYGHFVVNLHAYPNWDEAPK